MPNTKKKANSGEHKIQITVAIISTVGVIIAALIGVLPIITSRDNPQTLASTPTIVSPTSPPTATVIPSPVPSSTPVDPIIEAKNWPLVLFDDFSATTSNDWMTLWDTEDLVKTTFNLAFRINVTTKGQVRSAFYKRQNLIIDDPFLISVEGTVEEQTGCYYGILFKMANSENYYWFQIRHSTKYLLVRSINGDETDLIPEKDIPNGLTVKTLAVRGDNNHYKLYINDQLIDEFIDNSLQGAYAGLATRTCQYLETADYVFDNFEIHSPVTITASTEYTVEANKEWQDSGISIKQGDKVSIIYLDGEWRTNPADENYTNAKGYNTPLSMHVSEGANYGALIAKIGSDNPFEVGNSLVFTAGNSGTLYFQINDGLLSDNDGNILIQINISH